MFKPHGAHRARMLGVAALSVCTALLGTPATLAAPAQPAPASAGPAGPAGPAGSARGNWPDAVGAPGSTRGRGASAGSVRSAQVGAGQVDTVADIASDIEF